MSTTRPVWGSAEHLLQVISQTLVLSIYQKHTSPVGAFGLSKGGGVEKNLIFGGLGKKNSIFQRYLHKLHMILYIFRLFSQVIMQFNIF